MLSAEAEPHDGEFPVPLRPPRKRVARRPQVFHAGFDLIRVEPGLRIRAPIALERAGLRAPEDVGGDHDEAAFRVAIERFREPFGKAVDRGNDDQRGRRPFFRQRELGIERTAAGSGDRDHLRHALTAFASAC